MTSPYDPNAGYGSQPDPTGQPPYGQPAGGQPGNYPPPDQYGQQYGQPDQYNQPQYYPVDQPADQSYPTSGPSYPASGPAYPTSGPGYPTSGPGYPSSGAGYPGAQGYQQPGFPGGPGGQPPKSGNGKGLLIGGIIGGGALVFIVVIVLVVVAITKSDSKDDNPPQTTAHHSAEASSSPAPNDDNTDDSSESSEPQSSGGTYTAPSSLCDKAEFDGWKDSWGGSSIDPSDSKSGHDPTIEVCVWILGDYGKKSATVSYTGFFESDESGADRMYDYYKDQMNDNAKSGSIKTISGVGEQAFACINDSSSNSDSTEVDIFVQDGNLLLKEDVMLAVNGSAPSSSTVDDSYDTLKKTASATLANLG